MGTRSTIALEFADGTVQQVYCHWDGYLDHNGKILQEHYTNPFKVRDLIDLGAMSSLRETVDGSKEGAYAHSRSEELMINKYEDAADYFAECQQEEYDYILREVNGTPVWFVRCYASETEWVTIPQAEGLIEQMNEQGVY
jgi:hypothetical protein